MRVLVSMTMSTLLVGGTQTGHSYRLVICDIMTDMCNTHCVCVVIVRLSGPFKFIVVYYNVVLAEDVVVVVVVGWPQPVLA